MIFQVTPSSSSGHGSSISGGGLNPNASVFHSSKEMAGAATSPLLTSSLSADADEYLTSGADTPPDSATGAANSTTDGAATAVVTTQQINGYRADTADSGQYQVFHNRTGI